MISIIAAYARGRVIGRDGKIPWDIPEDRKWFKETTMGHILVMGRKTYEEIGKPLLGRYTVVVSKTGRFEGDSVHTVKSLDEAVGVAGGNDIFIAGGQSIYEEGIALAERMFITEIDADIPGDRFFPEFNRDEWEMKRVGHSEGKPGCSFIIFDKKVSYSDKKNSIDG